MGNNNSEFSDPVLVKLNEFAESIKKSQPIVFCVKCGSTLIDQTAIYRLSCLNCGNSALWDGYNFAIARHGDSHDAASSFENLERHYGHYNNWHFLVVKEIQDFARSTINFMPTLVTNANGVADAEMEGADYQKLVDGWEEFKSRIDRLIHNESD